MDRHRTAVLQARVWWSGEKPSGDVGGPRIPLMLLATSRAVLGRSRACRDGVCRTPRPAEPPLGPVPILRIGASDGPHLERVGGSALAVMMELGEEEAAAEQFQ